MIKKLILAATFAASMTVGVPSASASPFLCMQQYQAALNACGDDEDCQLDANVAYTACMQRLAGVDQ